jgi:hypothetical protein
MFPSRDVSLSALSDYEKISAMRTYLWNLLISFDQFLNTILAGHPDETISARIGRKLRESAPGCWLCKLPWPKWLREHFLETHT